MSLQTDAEPRGSLWAEETMARMITGFWVSRCIYVAAKLGVADLLADGPQMSEELAGATETHAPSLFRLLRALASVGILAEVSRNCFALTPLGATLRSGVPGSLRHLAIVELGEENYPAFSGRNTESLHVDSNTKVSVSWNHAPLGTRDRSTHRQARSADRFSGRVIEFGMSLWLVRHSNRV